jgi:chromosome segregation ATPase
VSKKKFDQLAQNKETLQKDFNRMRDAERERLIYADSLVRLNIRFAGATQEADEWKNRYYSIKVTLKDLNKELASLRYQNEQLQVVASSNNNALRQQLADKIRELDARDKDLRLLMEETKNYLNKSKQRPTDIIVLPKLD